MKKEDGSVLSVEKSEKKARQTKVEKIESLRQRLQGVLAYRDLINSSDPETQEKLRKEFKKEFKVTYNDKLIESLTGTENLESDKIVSQAKEIIQQAINDKNEEIRVESGVLHFDGYVDEAEKIDNEREQVVKGSIKKAGEVSGLKKVLDKVLKDYPYFEEKDLEKKEMKNRKEREALNFSDAEWAIIQQAQSGNDSSIANNFEFPESDPSQADAENIDVDAIRVEMAEQEVQEKHTINKEKPKKNTRGESKVKFSAEEWSSIEKARTGAKSEPEIAFPESDPSQSSVEDNIDIDAIRQEMAQQELLEKERILKPAKEASSAEASYDQMIKEGKEKVLSSIDESFNDIKAGYEAEESNDPLEVKPSAEGQNNEGQNNEGQNNEGQNNEGQNNEGQNNEGQNNEGQNNEEKKETEKDMFPQEIMDKFGNVGLDNDDLKTIPGLENLNPVALMTIASSLEVMALQRAEKEKERLIANSMYGKGRIGRALQTVANTFKQGKYEQRALYNQMGIEKNGPLLTNLVDWARDFEIQGFEYEKDGEKISTVDYALPFGYIPEELKAKFNVAASHLAGLPKHFQYQSGSLEKSGSKKMREQEYEAAQGEYEKAMKEIAASLKEQGLSDNTIARLSLRANGLVGMMQNLAANPDLEKEWNKMAEGSSFFRKLISKENAQYFAAGYASKFALAGIIGTVAVPLVAAGIASMRALKRSRNELIKKDSLASTNNRSESSWLEHRSEFLKTLQGLVPQEYSMDPIEWYSKVATEEQKKVYEECQSAIRYIDGKMKVVAQAESKDVNRKMLGANELASRLERDMDIIDKKYREGTYDVSTLARRVRFTYDSIDKGLVNYGEGAERPINMAKLFQVLQYCDRTVRIEGDKEENQILAEKMIAKIFERGQQKLSANRRRYLAKSMIRGAFMGATFALAGRAVNSLLENIGVYNAISSLKESIHLGHYAHVSGTLTENGSQVLDNASTGNAGSSVNEEITSSPAQEAASAPEEVEMTQVESSPEASGEPVRQAVESDAGRASAGQTQPDHVQNEIEGKATRTAQGEDPVKEAIEGKTPRTTIAEGGSDPVRAEVEGKAASFRDSISNEDIKGSDSVWRSTKQIFLDNAAKLGYKGGLNDSAALDNWASANTNTALANSGDITDKVFEGNIVTLENSGDGFAVSVEAGEGATPGHLPAIETIETIESPEPVVGSPLQDSDLGLKVAEMSGADYAHATYGIDPKDIVEADGQVITANIEGKEVFINVATDSYVYFDGDQEMSGFLDLSGSESIYDVIGGYEDLDLSAGLDGNTGLEQDGPLPTAEDIGKFIAQNKDISAADLKANTLLKIEQASGVKNLESLMSRRESRTLIGIIEKIEAKGFNDKIGKELQQFIEKVAKNHK